MKVVIGEGVRIAGWFVLFVLVAPAVVLGGWLALRVVLPELSLWQLVLIIQIAAGIIFFGLFLWYRRPVYQSDPRDLERIISKEQFEYLYERSPVPYLTLDRSGTISTANLAAVRFFRATMESVIGLDFSGLVTDENEAALSVLLGKIRSGVSVEEIESQIKVADESKRWVLLSVFVYDSSNERLVALVDITQQKLIDIAKSEFVALAAHQLRTPVAAVRWNVELLKGDLGTQLSEEIARYFTKVERNVLKMVNLIDDFLSVSKLETGTFATEMGSVEMASFCNSVIDEFAGTIEKKQLQVSTHYDPPDLVFTADKRLLHIIVSNLTSNATKYIDQGGQVSLRYDATPTQLTLTVADTGIGIPASEIENLFTKFFRATNAQAHKSEGTGLGLYIVQQSVEKMGGTIDVQSEEGVGTTFTVVLPRVQATA